jgi:hypothetical protein
MAIGSQPDTVNFLSPLGFKLIIERAPSVNYFVQAVALPSVNLGQASVPTPFTRVQLGGDHVTYSELAVTFKVDEKFENYIEMLNWINGLGFPDSFDQSFDRSVTFPAADKQALSDIKLIILSSSKNPTREITFIDAHPTSLTSLNFTSTLSDVDHLECTVTFTFRTFVINTI